jgi:hypothetical protein
MAAEAHGKCVEVFGDMLPWVRKVAALGNASDPFMPPSHGQGRHRLSVRVRSPRAAAWENALTEQASSDTAARMSTHHPAPPSQGLKYVKHDGRRWPEFQSTRNSRPSQKLDLDHAG